MKTPRKSVRRAPVIDDDPDYVVNSARRGSET
jgi:hypothetical protein